MVGVLDFLGLGDSTETVEGPTYGSDDAGIKQWSVELDQGVAAVEPANANDVSQVYMAYRGEVGTDASRYLPVTRDEDGDLVFSFTIDQDILNAHKFFVKHLGNEDLKRIPQGDIIIDKDADIRVRVEAFAHTRSDPAMLATWRIVPKEQVTSGNPVFNYSGGTHRFFDGAHWTAFAAPRLDSFGQDFFYAFA